MNHHHAPALKLSSHSRLAAAALALALTLGTLLSVDRLASSDLRSPLLAQTGSARA